MQREIITHPKNESYSILMFQLATVQTCDTMQLKRRWNTSARGELAKRIPEFPRHANWGVVFAKVILTCCGAMAFNPCGLTAHLVHQQHDSTSAARQPLGSCQVSMLSGQLVAASKRGHTQVKHPGEFGPFGEFSSLRAVVLDCFKKCRLVGQVPPGLLSWLECTRPEDDLQQSLQFTAFG